MKNTNFLSIALLTVALSGCSGITNKPDDTERPASPSTPSQAPTQPAPPVTPTAPATQATEPEPSKGSGGYYKDDGPGDAPITISNIQDPVPQVEPYNTKSNRPYTALGKQYKPMKAYESYKKRGVASWYGKRFHGNKTSSGERYDMYKMSAAHTTLPIPSYARVTNLSNKRSVIVRINDRGPFHKDRLIDLSYAAAYKIGLLANGSIEVEVEAIDPRQPNNQDSADTSKTEVALQEKVSEPANNTAPTSETSNPGVYVQVAAYKVRESAEKMLDKLKSENLAEDVPVQNMYNNGTYRVRIGPYTDRDSADKAVTLIKQKLGISAIIVNTK